MSFRRQQRFIDSCSFGASLHDRFRRYFVVNITALTLVLSSCLPTPDVAVRNDGVLGAGGVFVVCEGLWRQNNSVLSWVGLDGTVVRDVVSVVNTSMDLGDTASDIVVRGDTIFIAVSTSRSIELFRRSSGLWIGRIPAPQGAEPYRMALADDSTIFVTNLTDDSITEVDIRNGRLRVERVPVGPAPEGIAVLRNRIFVANSGYGDLRSGEAGAGTVDVYARSDLSRVRRIDALPNAAAIVADADRNRIWVSYRNLPSRKDEVGGVALIDASSFEILRRWSMDAPRGLTLDRSSGDVFVLHSLGVSRIRGTSDTMSMVIRHRSGSGSDVWYSLAYQAEAGTLWIGNARSYVTDGEVLAYDTTGKRLLAAPVGLNPTAFAFR